jgi:PHD/YefM family antitoxin component YafN of YafNO toxin-antitoxin module
MKTEEDYEALIETIEILSDEDALDQLRKSLRELNDEETLAWDEVKKTL